MLGANNHESRIYLSVGFGKLRQKSVGRERVTSATPNAVKRLTQQNAETWALEYDYVEGVIENIFFKPDEQYGHSFEVVIVDVLDSYQVSFTEDSRTWFDLAKKLPNIVLTDRVKITPYDFDDKQTGKKRSGVSVVQFGEKVVSAYEVKNAGGQWACLHGFPESTDVDWKDKDDIKLYMIKVKKFIRSEMSNKIIPLFVKAESEKQVPDEGAPFDELPLEDASNMISGTNAVPHVDDDLPF